MIDDFKQNFIDSAIRMVGVAPRCANEEGTKMFLVLPFLSFIGYDISNPDEVCPEHNADFSEKYKNRVDYAILKDSSPVIAVECKSTGAALRDDRGQLRSYFNAAPTVKMGVITDGLLYEFYADSDEPNMMDANAFLSFNLTQVAEGKIEDSVVEGLKSLERKSFDPENIGAEAKRKLIFQSLVQRINELATRPSKAFVRLILQEIGISGVRSKSLPDYVSLTQRAFEEFINIKILKRLDLSNKATQQEDPVVSLEANANESAINPLETDQLGEEEAAFLNNVKQRLAFLSETDMLFDAINDVDFKAYRDCVVVFYKKERLGRLFRIKRDRSAVRAVEFDQEYGGRIPIEDTALIHQSLKKVFQDKVGAFADGGKVVRKEVETADL